jgi:hypothetical protein
MARKLKPISEMQRDLRRRDLVRLVVRNNEEDKTPDSYAVYFEGVEFHSWGESESLTRAYFCPNFNLSREQIFYGVNLDKLQGLFKIYTKTSPTNGGAIIGYKVLQRAKQKK